MLIFAARLAGSRQLIHGQGDGNVEGGRKTKGSRSSPWWDLHSHVCSQLGNLQDQQRDVGTRGTQHCHCWPRAKARRGCRRRKADEPEAMSPVCPHCTPPSTARLRASLPSAQVHICGPTSAAAALSPGLCSGDHCAPVTQAALTFHGHAAGSAHRAPSGGTQSQLPPVTARGAPEKQALSHHGCAHTVRRSWTGSSHLRGGDGESWAGAPLLSLLCPQPCSGGHGWCSWGCVQVPTLPDSPTCHRLCLSVTKAPWQPRDGPGAAEGCSGLTSPCCSPTAATGTGTNQNRAPVSRNPPQDLSPWLQMEQKEIVAKRICQKFCFFYF